jgi:hypothetical protein
VLASAPAAQGQPQIDARLRFVDAKTSVPLPEFPYVLRDGDGAVIAPIGHQDAETSFLVHGRKLIVEPLVRTEKPSAQSFFLEDARLIYVTLRVDELTGRILEVEQKPILTGSGPRARKAPRGGTIPLGGPIDDCATPGTPTCGSSTAFNNAGFTTVAGDPAFTCRIGGSAQGFGTSWFRFVATGTSATLDTNGSSTGDTLLAVYSGTCGALTQIGCDDDAGAGLLSLVTVPGLTIGQTYYVQVAGWAASNVGNNVLNIACSGGGPPAHDQCATAQPVNCNSSTAFNNAANTTSGTDPVYTCRIGGPAQGFGTAWFTFVATGASATIDTEGSATGDTLLAVYSGTCGALTQIGCDDDAGTGFLSLVNVAGLTVGQTYYIQVAGWAASNVGNNVLNVTCLVGPPPGDACADAVEIPCGGSDTINNSAYTTDAGDPAYSCRFGGPGQGVGTVWFKFTATHTSAHIDTSGSTAFDTLLAVYDGTCGAFVELACDDDNGPGLLSDLCVEGLTIGNLYYIQASSFSAFDTGDVTVNVECPCPAPPTNDECEDAIALGAPPFSVNYDTTLATDDIGVPCGVFSGPFNNVWHTVTGTGNTITLTTCNGGTTHPDTKLSVFCGECLELVCVAGNDDDCAGGGPTFASTVSWCSQNGIQYLVTTGGFASGQVGFVQLDATDDGSPCFPDVQCLPVGACCLPSGTCAVVTVGDCEGLGGVYQGDGTECTSNAIVDGGFEAGVFSGNWNESSTNFGTPICDGSCGFGGGTGPNSGSFWAWFGGIPAFEEGAVSQAVTIPVGATTLDFFLEVPVSSGNGVDFLEVTVDGNQEYLVLENVGPFVGYVLQQVNIAAYADGGNHTVEFHSIITGAGGDFTNFFVDDISINTISIFCPPPIECFSLDFETDDSGAGMAHGARVNTEFDGGANYPVTITGSTNPTLANTAAILNSTTGPAAQDPDLLVGKGNILMLQNDGNQSLCGPDTYCTHNDDEDGGSLSFVFNVPTTPTSIVLIDSDATDSTWTVVLTDTNGFTRTYTVPANWTGDLVSDGPPGYGTLCLNCVNVQPGFGSNATVATNFNYDPDAVVSIVVNIGGSGAVDDLEWCQSNE